MRGVRPKWRWGDVMLLAHMVDNIVSALLFVVE